MDNKIEQPPATPFAHHISSSETLNLLDSSVTGLDNDEAASRLSHYGRNTLPKGAHTPVLIIFLRQFLDPLIYILLFAALISFIIEHYTDTGFILAVLFINALIGTIQERSAQHSASSLDILITDLAHVVRNGETYEIHSDELVPGDILLLESGDRVPADIRLISELDLRIDESLLSGESLPAEKDADVTLAKDAAIQERSNMVFSGTLVVYGRATGVVTATGMRTELGKIAKVVLQQQKTKPPLLVRLERFSWRLTWFMAGVTLLIAGIVFYQGMPLLEVLLLSAALAIAAIPEGLPVAITIALAISVRRMAKRNVIARNLVAVEALGSCTFIATDKTGTLTRNEITVECIALPDQQEIILPSPGILPPEQISQYSDHFSSAQLPLVHQLTTAMVLSNEAFLGHRDGNWSHHGDSMDVALLILGHNLGLSRTDLLQQFRQLSILPFESVKRFSASLHATDSNTVVFVKGAVETLLEMCSHVSTTEGNKPLNKQQVLDQAHRLAEKGYRVLAAASASFSETDNRQLHETDLKNMTLLGLTGMIDPLRTESKAAIESCHSAGIEVAMLTGDHPTTAYTIANQLNLAHSPAEIITSHELRKLENEPARRIESVKDKHVFARLEPHQKLDIVKALQDSGHFVAMTGDGANDAPALRMAHVGIAMGKSGTAVARETADIILTDDNFASIVAGIEEGRIAYNNVRKVVHLLISTGVGEIILFLLSILSGLPIPLTAVQLLWLNLVTNGIQDVALAFEPGEGNELNKPPRRPGEAIFNRVMIERVVLAACVIGMTSFAVFYYLINTGMSVDNARNGTLLLMVLFENMHALNSRSESLSVFKQSLLNNKLLTGSIIGSQILHFAAMQIPAAADILSLSPVSAAEWVKYLVVSLSLLLASEIYKAVRNR